MNELSKDMQGPERTDIAPSRQESSGEAPAAPLTEPVANSATAPVTDTAAGSVTEHTTPQTTEHKAEHAAEPASEPAPEPGSDSVSETAVESASENAIAPPADKPRRKRARGRGRGRESRERRTDPEGGNERSSPVDFDGERDGFSEHAAERLTHEPAEFTDSADESNAPDDILATCGEALDAAEKYLLACQKAVLHRVSEDGALDAGLLEREQMAAHGYAWVATYVVALRALLAWARELQDSGRLQMVELLILVTGFGEYLAQLQGGIAMSQTEVARPADLGVAPRDVDALRVPAVRALLDARSDPTLGRRLCDALIERQGYGEVALGDEALILMAEQIRRYVNDTIAPQAQAWHRNDVLIPDEVLATLAEMGVFGVTVPEAYGGLGLGKVAMCVVTEELSRGYLGVGSLGTRSEIAAELIASGGTEEQKAKWLPAIASGKVLPTAVFTEPNTGSDLASLQTRAEAVDDDYRITGAKTWITHASRSDLMTLLARTGAPDSGYKGLSMFLIEKPRGTPENAFPVAGLSGSEIRVLGYRGMKEYELAFDGLVTPKASLLGEEPGWGFKQLMATFEAARIQTAARAVGVAQNALELGMQYAGERRQFGKPIIEFPRIAGKLAWMAVETMIARQLTLYAARVKDRGRRCDIEAGMAKLLAARVAWANADAALQIHGGNGYAEEYPISRVLVDARILSIFEGAAEIQAGVIAKGLLAQRSKK